jgi:fatty-acyl-CoA synthase
VGIRSRGQSYWEAEDEGVTLLDTTLGDLLDCRAEELPAREAVVYSGYPELGDGFDLRWTYAEYRERVNAVAKGLIALGLQRGDHVAVWATNLPEWLLLEFAIAKAGLVLVTVNPVFRANELAYVLAQGDAKALFFQARVRDHDCLETVRDLITPGDAPGVVGGERLPELRYVCVIGAPPVGPATEPGWRPATFAELIEAGTTVDDEKLRARQAAVRPRDVSTIMYTSGTTGFPKGAMLTHFGLINNQVTAWQRVGGRATDQARYCTPVPFFHVAGAGVTIGMVVERMTLHPVITFDPLKTLQIIRREGCTYVGAVPTMLLAMLHHPEFDAYRPESLDTVFTGAAPVPVLLMEQVKERMGADIGIAFGQTEASSGITSTSREDSFEKKSATVGRPYPHVAIKIIETETGAIVPCGQRGELCVRGFLVMAGYYKMPEMTAEAIDADRWLHTGDLATMNEAGYVNIVGRLKDMVIRGGENIFPREIEEVLIRHPAVADVQVVGVPDAYFGEVLLAVVRAKDGAQLTEQEVRGFCQDRLSHQKVPRYVQFVASYPLTASGKVQKFRLRETAIKALGLEDLARTRTA